MNPLAKLVIDHPKLNQILSSRKYIQRVAGRYVAGENIEDIFDSLKSYNDQKFGVLLYPIEGTAEDYVEAIRLIGENNLFGSVTMRSSLKNLDAVVREAICYDVRLEFDMRQERTVDKTINVYQQVRKVHPNTVICLQSNLYRTQQDWEKLVADNAIVRLVKGAFKEENSILGKEEVDDNLLKLAQKIVFGKGAKVYLATHDEKVITDFIDLVENEDIPKEKFGFQMLAGIRTDLQDKLNKQGYEVWKYLVYGEDWLPYCINRMFERKENFIYALKEIVGGRKNVT